jgi:hypothetical protein
VNKLITVLLAATLATAAQAAKTPETITFELTRAGNVPFPHKLHAARGCKSCHPALPAKLGLTKDKAHALCKGCHEAQGKGPNKCDGCHKR